VAFLSLVLKKNRFKPHLIILYGYISFLYKWEMETIA